MYLGQISEATLLLGDTINNNNIAKWVINYHRGPLLNNRIC